MPSSTTIICTDSRSDERNLHGYRVPAGRDRHFYRHHDPAVACYRKLVSRKWPVVTTEAVLIEIGNGLSKLKWRQTAITSIEKKKSGTIFTVMPATADLLARAVRLYGERADKEWGLTDCLSFVTMKDRGLTLALTVDHHFKQAGFKICMDID